MKSMYAIAGLTLALIQLPIAAMAQTDSKPMFGDAQAVVEINLAEFRSTELGEKILSYAKAQAMEAVAEQGDEGAPKLEDINDFLGFDPFEEIRGAVIAINDLENPQENLVGVIQLGETTGNIEGLLLGLPGYESEKEDGVTVHSGEFDGQRMYAAIHTKGKTKTIVIAPDKDRLLSTIGQVGDSRKMVGKSSSDQAPFVRVSVNKLPLEMIGEGPQANIAKLVESLELTVAESGDQLAANLEIITDNSEHAEQIRQMADGLKAMLGFALSQESDDQDLKRVVELAKGLKVSSDDNHCNAALSVPVKLVLEFLSKEAGLNF